MRPPHPHFACVSLARLPPAVRSPPPARLYPPTGRLRPKTHRSSPLSPPHLPRRQAAAPFARRIKEEAFHDSGGGNDSPSLSISLSLPGEASRRSLSFSQTHSHTHSLAPQAATSTPEIRSISSFGGDGVRRAASGLEKRSAGDGFLPRARFPPPRHVTVSASHAPPL